MNQRRAKLEPTERAERTSLAAISGSLQIVDLDGTIMGIVAMKFVLLLAHEVSFAIIRTNSANRR